MITKLQKAECAYEPLPRNTIQAITDPTALAVWVYLMSKPSGWIVRGKDIEKHFGFGRDKRLKAVKALESLGLYIVSPAYDENGKLAGKKVEIYYDINPARGQNPRCTENTTVENPDVRKTRSSENPTPYINRDILNNTDTPQTPQGAPVCSGDFEKNSAQDEEPVNNKTSSADETKSKAYAMLNMIKAECALLGSKGRLSRIEFLDALRYAEGIKDIRAFVKAFKGHIADEGQYAKRLVNFMADYVTDGPKKSKNPDWIEVM